MALFDELGDALGGGNLGALSGFLGADNDDQASGLLGMAGPALLGALGKRSSTSAGADAIFGAVQEADDGILDNLSGFLGGGDVGGLGGKLVGGLLGSKRGAVESGLASQAGVGGGMVAKLLPMLAPMVMSFLKKKMAGGGGGAGGLASMLGDNTNAMRSGGLGSILDLLDGDDDPSDEAGFLDSFKSMAGVGGATAAAGAVASKVTGGLGDGASKVTGGVRDGADRAKSMANVDAPKGGGGLMKWLLPLLLIAAVVALLLWACSGGDGDGDSGGDGAASVSADGLADLGGRTVTVGVENAYLPFNYIAVGDSEGSGWDYDAWNEICRLLNCTPEFVAAGWPDVIDQVAQGELDTAADGISITEERAEIVAFSDAYMTVQQKFIVGLDDDRYSSADDIVSGDAIVATQVGTTNFELAEELLGGTSRIQAFDQFGLAIQALIAGDVDAVIIDDAAGLGYIGENADQVKTIDDGLQSDPLGFIYPLESDLVDPVNDALNVMKSSGFLDEIGAKFFGEEFTITYDDIEG